MLKHRAGVLIGILLLLNSTVLFSNSQAAPIEALSVSGAQLQTDISGNFNVGWSFTVNAPIAVSSLGWYNTDGTQLYDVGLYTSAGSLLASGTGIGSAALSANGFSYQSLTAPVTLAAGNYIIGGSTTGTGIYAWASSVNTVSQISYTGGLYSVGAGLACPTIGSDRGTSYFGPSFQIYNAAPQISLNVGSNIASVGTNTAGVVSAGNWNDIAAGAQSNIVLKDSAGNASTLKLSVPDTASTDSHANFGAGNEGDTAMMRGHIYVGGGSALDLSFTGKVPYEKFDVYVYYNSGAVTNTQTISILDSNGNSLGLSQVGYDVIDANRGLPGEVPDSSYVLSDGVGGNNANYVKFSGLTSASIPENFIIRAQGTGSEYAYINGIQFVQVPEPGVMTVLVTGLFSLLAYAWRKRK